MESQNTPISKSKRFSRGRRLPTDNNNWNSCSLEELTAAYQKLLQEQADLDKVIQEFKEKGVSTDLQPQMKALHRYNEMKDCTQAVLGYLGSVELVSTSELHRRYDLPME